MSADHEAPRSLLDRTVLRDVRLQSISGRNGDVPIEGILARVSMEPPAYRIEAGLMLVRLVTGVRYLEAPTATRAVSQPNDEDLREVGAIEVAHLAELELDGDLEGVSDEEMRIFLEGNILFMMYPYIRSDLHRLSSELALPPTVLPYLRRSSLPTLGGDGADV